MTTRTFTVESPVEITFKGDSAVISEQVLRAAMRPSWGRVVYFGELADDPECNAEILASIKA